MPSAKVTSDAGVSVVIPAYNYARYLPKAIDSVLLQEYRNYEIIVVDDGSTDNTAEVVAAYGDKVRYIHQTNAGLPAARNTGVKAACYDFVGFLDADDEWLPTMLKESMATFRRLPEEFALVACRAVVVDPNSNPINRKRYVPTAPWEITCRDLLMKSQFSPSAVIARKCAFQTVGLFDSTLRSSEDRDMWIRILTRYRGMLNGDRLILYRRHSNNMSKNSDRMRVNTRRVLRSAFRKSYVSRTAIFFWLRIFSFNHYETAWMYQDEGRKGDALRELIFSLALWPFFPKTGLLNEPRFFRIRSLVRFARGLVSSNGNPAPPAPAKQGT